MLIYLFLLMLTSPIVLLASLLPSVTELPFGLDALLSSGVSNFLYVAALIPPLATLYNAFLWVVGFKIGLRLFLMIPIVGRMFK